jgi:hypothetical protein
MIVLQSMKQLKEAYAAGKFKGMTARILWEEDEQGYILDIADTNLTVLSPIFTAASSRKPYEVRVFKSLEGATAFLTKIGFTECVVHLS